MTILYNLIFLLVAVVYLPAYLLRRKFHRGFSLRLGKIPQGRSFERPIWVHAVSVGEAMAVAGLVEQLRKALPGKKFVISTVTATGNKIAQRIAKEGDFVTYLPLDLSFMVKKTIDRISPELFIIAETEIWPNLITQLHRKNIPIVTVNGRLSDSSFAGYSSVKFLLRPVISKVSLFCVQSLRDRERLISLGVLAEKIEVTGNMKFDNLAPDARDSQARGMLRIKDKERLIVAGSTHPKEEQVLLQTFRALFAGDKSLRFLIAPRHPERSAEVERLSVQYGFRPMAVSALKPSEDNRTIFILDTIGQLMNFYAAADIVFVGGSLIRKGGHNILEPAIFAKPVLFGNHMFNFRDIKDLFLEAKAGLMVQGYDDLFRDVRGLLDDYPKALEMGQRARQLIINNRGATLRNVELIRPFLGVS